MSERYTEHATAIALSASDAATGGLNIVQLSPPGHVQTLNGSYLMDREASEAIIERFKAHRTPVVIDFEHQSLGGEFASPDGTAPASGFIHRVTFSEVAGLMGHVEWNDRGRELIRSGAYRSLSPVLWVRKSDHRAVELHSAALTNKPAIPGMERLAAKILPKQKELQVMADQPQPNQPAQPGQPEPEGEKASPQEIVASIATMLNIKLGGGIDATLNAILAKVEALVSDGDGSDDSKTAIASAVRAKLGLASDASKSEILVAMHVSGADGGAIEQLNAMRTSEADRVARAHVARFVSEGKINQYDTEAIECAVSLAIENPERLDALFLNAPRVIPPDGQTEPPTSRQRMIIECQQDFRHDEALQKTTSCGAYVSMRLKDSGLDRLSEAEEHELVI